MITYQNKPGESIDARRTKAKQYAAAARERNKPTCDCERCKYDATLPIIQRVIERWKR